MESVYHSGEKEIQKRVGELLRAESNGRVITNTIIKGAINFIEKQPMAIVSSVDNKNRIWTSLLIGDHGFVTVPTQNNLNIDIEKIHSDPHDIFFKNISDNGNMGSLFIEFETRRRFRINGAAKVSENQIELTVKEAYPNCPKYIQQRVISRPEGFKKTNAIKTMGRKINDDIKRWITSSDTLFVGSQGQSLSLDASHRGGPPGFVEFVDKQILKIPDYVGNSMYNTLGNILQNPNVGLLFIDFNKGKTLQLTGKASILFEQQNASDLIKTTGTGRFWLFSPEEWIITENHHDVSWELLSYSPFNPTI
ncbi:MAG: pyridoxamine 5'-phosphate oxidase family protein [Bacteroidetes bacterium]|nr:pyridoxamine 5'-phosphate oxidase family protein [Bacteroidota bacterium]